jgi:hypothetical protein
VTQGRLHLCEVRLLATLGDWSKLKYNNKSNAVACRYPRLLQEHEIHVPHAVLSLKFNTGPSRVTVIIIF